MNDAEREVLGEAVRKLLVRTVALSLAVYFTKDTRNAQFAVDISGVFERHIMSALDDPTPPEAA